MDPDPPLLRLVREAAAVAAAANHVLVSFHDLSALPVAVQVGFAFGPHVRKLQAGSLAPSSVCRCSERLLPSPVHPDVMRGVKVASVAWFILRIPREELACEDLRPGLVACAV